MRILALLCALAVSVAAQECPLGKAAAEKAAPAKVSAVAKIEKLEASAAKGCETSGALLTKLVAMVKADDVAGLKTKVALCEQYADKGCGVSAKVVATINTELTRKAAPKLSERLAYYATCADKGCEKSATVLAPILKTQGVEKPADLIAAVKAWETKALDGCGSCVTKLETIAAMLPARRAPAALSERVAYLGRCGEGGCEASATALKPLLAAHEAKDAAELAAKVEAWETKAAAGCQSSFTKLAKLEATLTGPATAKPASAKPASDCTDCGDGCKDCPGKG